jgi:AraC family transcriptional activator of pyochelin receptor
MEVIHLAGLEVVIDQRTVDRGTTWSSTTPDGLWFGALLSGEISILGARTTEGIWRGGHALGFAVPSPRATVHQALQDGPIAAVFVRVSPDNVDDIIGSDGHRLFEERSRSPTREVPQDRVNRLCHALARQMLSSPLVGPARRLYLAGKALEMIALLINDRHDSSPGPAPTPSIQDWPPGDVERLRQAQAILLDNLATPPTVPALARAVGLNARKLSRGFVALHGIPVYGFIKAHRLENARLMLEAGETGIAQVAYALGYQPAHFTTEFRKRYGVTPSALIGRRGRGEPKPE